MTVTQAICLLLRGCAEVPQVKDSTQPVPEMHITPMGDGCIVAYVHHLPSGAKARREWWLQATIDEAKELEELQRLVAAFEDMVKFKNLLSRRQTHGRIAAIDDDGTVTLSDRSDAQFFMVGACVAEHQTGEHKWVHFVDRDGGRIAFTWPSERLRVGAELFVSVSGEVE
jgi:hypothetical protein